MFALCTVNDVILYQRGTVDASLTPLIQRLILGVSRRFASYCGREHWDYGVTNDVHDGGADRVYLRHWPIDPAQAVTVQIDPARQWTGAPVDPSLYVLDADDGTLYFVTTVPAIAPRSIRVSYTGGYLTADGVGAPEDLAMLATLQAGFFFQRRSDLGLVAHSLEGSTITQEQRLTLLPEVRNGLWPYRRQVFA